MFRLPACNWPSSTKFTHRTGFRPKHWELLRWWVKRILEEQHAVVIFVVLFKLVFFTVGICVSENRPNKPSNGSFLLEQKEEATDEERIESSRWQWQDTTENCCSDNLISRNETTKFSFSSISTFYCVSLPVDDDHNISSRAFDCGDNMREIAEMAIVGWMVESNRFLGSWEGDDRWLK